MERLLETGVHEEDALRGFGAFKAGNEPDEIAIGRRHASGSEGFPALRDDEPYEIRDGDVAKAVDLFQGEPESEAVFEVGKGEEESERVEPQVARENMTFEDFHDVDAGVRANDLSDDRVLRASGHGLHIRVSTLGINKKGHRRSGAPEPMLDVCYD